MIRSMYAIKDSKTCFQPEIVMLENDDAAVRWFNQLLLDYRDNERLKNAPLLTYRDDFDLVCVGRFVTTTGTIYDCVESFDETGKLIEKSCPYTVINAGSFCL